MALLLTRRLSPEKAVPTPQLSRTCTLDRPEPSKEERELNGAPGARGLPSEAWHGHAGRHGTAVRPMHPVLLTQLLHACAHAAVKLKLIQQWCPEYTSEEVRPPQDTPDVHSERATNVTLSMVLKEQVGTHHNGGLVASPSWGCQGR